MCNATFTFGQRGNHFFQCPSRKDYTRLPKKLAALLSSTQLKRVHHVTLGFENSFLITYRDTSGHDHIESQGLPKELNDFLYATHSNGTPLRQITKLRLTLGPHNTSFFVHDSASYLWLNLPSHLLSALQSRIKDGTWIDKPRIVALGADSNFLLITEKHAAVWDLSHYRRVNEMLEFSKTQEKGIEEVKNVVLHGYRYQCFLAQSRNGTLIYENLPPHEVAGMESMRQPIQKDTQEAERRAKDRDQDWRLGRTNSLRRDSGVGNTDGEMQRRSSLHRQATLRRDWGEHKQEFRASAKGLKLSLSLSINAGAALGKMLG